jgi:hypothetical protein
MPYGASTGMVEITSGEGASPLQATSSSLIAACDARIALAWARTICPAAVMEILRRLRSTSSTPSSSSSAMIFFETCDWETNSSCAALM